MARDLHEETVLKFYARLDQRTRQRPIESISPTDAYPGSLEKIAVLSDRVARAALLGQELPLYHPGDGKLPLGQAWKIWVGPNGRIINKKLVGEKRAGVFVIATEITPTLIEQLREDFGPGVRIVHQSPEPPAQPQRRGVA